jgi:hypothetical protein
MYSSLSPEIIATFALPQIMASREYFPPFSSINDVDDLTAAALYGLRTDRQVARPGPWSGMAREPVAALDWRFSSLNGL